MALMGQAFFYKIFIPCQLFNFRYVLFCLLILLQIFLASEVLITTCFATELMVGSYLDLFLIVRWLGKIGAGVIFLSTLGSKYKILSLILQARSCWPFSLFFLAEELLGNEMVFSLDFLIVGSGIDCWLFTLWVVERLLMWLVVCHYVSS